MISLQDMITQIDAGEVFDITYCTLDRARGTGGRLVTLSKVVKHTSQRVPRSEMPPESVNKKRPNHALNFTRNLYQQDVRKIKTVHLLLVTRFNGHQVL